jgi:hypothetical protein
MANHLPNLFGQTKAESLPKPSEAAEFALRVYSAGAGRRAEAQRQPKRAAPTTPHEAPYAR